MKKRIYRIINEEISKFDFLGMSNRNKNMELADILNDTVFQKQFICDYLNDSDKVKYIEVTNNIINDGELDEDGMYINVQYAQKFSYMYDSDEEPIEIELEIEGDNIFLQLVGVGDNEKLQIEWLDFELSIYNGDGEIVNFKEISRMPSNTYKRICKKLGYWFIEGGVNMKLKDDVKNEPNDYCY